MIAQIDVRRWSLRTKPTAMTTITYDQQDLARRALGNAAAARLPEIRDVDGRVTPADGCVATSATVRGVADASRRHRRRRADGLQRDGRGS